MAAAAAHAVHAVRDRTWRGSTHHLIIDNGCVYLDVIATGASKASISNLSMDGWGTCSQLVGCVFPARAYEVAFRDVDGTGNEKGKKSVALNADAARDVLENVRAAVDAIVNQNGWRQSDPELVSKLASHGLATETPAAAPAARAAAAAAPTPRAAAAAAPAAASSEAPGEAGADAV
jgi:hypothetical protein